ncbi:phospholipase C, phosphocholine-specific [Streptomyces sp. NA04227]|uniref:phosphocholine-specific phospholipase C n=1 Tax=Streptomyces sp. NA04227 TaxID=2742136 RepID=UPI0015910713|nr:phospholipase C, phosphocholine-specific [Streptomyces sp. NA04227]QKW10131.1 phospholipase C, phosphocholine-specific [Streptomyces sp. NA04227]
MTGINRRRFMQLAGGTAAMTALTATIAKAAAIPANRRTNSLEDIEHIVVLMQENRSFDHYYGALRGVRGFGDPRPVKLPNNRPVWYQSDGTKEIPPFRPDTDDLGMKFIEGLNHDWDGGHAAFNNGNYDKWIPAKGGGTMAHLTREDIPFHYALADAFTICDAYHCSLMTATDPNRYYMWSGYCGNDGTGGGPVIDNAEKGYGWKTYPERLEEAGVSWKIYQDIGDGLDAAGKWGWIDDAYRGNYGDNSLLYFNSYREAQPGNPLYDKARTGTNAKAGDGYFDILKADVTSGKLPQISWVVAPEAFTEHPNWPANYGAWYIAQVLEALTADPEVWSKTALLITFDENDGYFDHVVPPYAPKDANEGLSTVGVEGEYYTPKGGAKYVPGHYGLGQRVPMLVVSPWSTGGYVCSQTFDHTSILQFMEQRFGVQEPNISAWRRAVCGDLTAAFDFSRADGNVPELPDTDAYEPPDHERHESYVPPVPAQGKLPAQESGRRPARALPYDLAVDARTADDPKRFRLDFASHGKAGAHFHVTSDIRSDAPWVYTVGAGDTLSDTWATDSGKGGAYDLTVHGPSGLYRRFKGRVSQQGPEVTARHEASSGRVRIKLTQRGTATVTVTLKDAYAGNAATTYTLKPGASVEHLTREVEHGWYDVTVTSGHDAEYQRRYAGHVETGSPSTSDPALGA